MHSNSVTVSIDLKIQACRVPTTWQNLSDRQSKRTLSFASCEAPTISLCQLLP